MCKTPGDGLLLRMVVLGVIPIQKEVNVVLPNDGDCLHAEAAVGERTAYCASEDGKQYNDIVTTIFLK
jgi:hypothetical protein